MVGFQVGQRVVVTEGPFATLEAVVVELGENSTTANGTITLFGRAVSVTLSAGVESPVAAQPDRSEEIARHAKAIRYYGIVGRIVDGSEAGRYIRVDRVEDLAETVEEGTEAIGDMIRKADDPDMEVDCWGEWVEDWAAVEETLLRDGYQVSWTPEQVGSPKDQTSGGSVGPS